MSFYFNWLLKITNNVELCVIFVLSLVYLLWKVVLFEIFCLVQLVFTLKAV